MSKTPYDEKNETSFWKTGVADISLGHDLFSNLHDIDLSASKTRISSAGSCFAQHVGQWLIDGNCLFNQSEIETGQVSSFAFGNIYTPKCFLQWLGMADKLDVADYRHTIYYDGHRYFDLLRPSFNTLGFKTKSELVKGRLDAVREMHEVIEKTDALIFTLGLTEAWKDIKNIFYPVCVGTISGKFNTALYHFHQFSYDEIMQDLLEIAALLKKIKPDLKIILTVSPVPLTATATDNHVLVANQYSKSVLRSVAGNLSNRFDYFEYFPSYEIITISNDDDFRFGRNKRSVTASALNYVKEHFWTAFNSPPMPVASTNNPSKNDVVCDEELLDAINKMTPQVNENLSISLTLIGDSQMGKLSKSLDNINLEHCGGMVMSGSSFTDQKFALCDTEYFVPLESPETRWLWAPIYTNIKSHEIEGTVSRSTILTNIGLQSHRSVSLALDWITQEKKRENTNVSEVNTVSRGDFMNYLMKVNRNQLTILVRLRNSGHKIVVVSDPPFFNHFGVSKFLTPFFYEYFDAFKQILEAADIVFYNAAAVFEQEITVPDDYKVRELSEDGEPDWCHGSEKYYDWLAQKLVTFLKLSSA